MKKISHLILGGVLSLLCAQLPAQSISDARSALFSFDFDSAQNILASQPATAEAQILRSLVDVGLWVENDLPTFAASIGADASAASELTDLSSYLARDGVGADLQAIYGSSTPLVISESGGIRTYTFPGDQKGVLVLHNTSDQDQAVDFEVNFGEMSNGLNLFANNEYMGRVSLWDLQIWDYYENWYNESTNQRSFSLWLEPGDYVRLEEDHNGGAELTMLSFAKSASIEEQNGDYWRYNWLRDPANALFKFELLETSGAGWQTDGQLILTDELGNTTDTQDLDYWLSTNDLYQSWDPSGRLMTLEYTGTSARQVDLTLYQRPGEMNQLGGYDQPAGFSGNLYLNGIELGVFNQYGFSLDAAEVEEWNYDGDGRDASEPLYTISLWLEPGDQLTLQAEPSWGSYSGGDENPDEPLVGFTLDAANDFAASNGNGYLNVYPKLSSGTNSDQFAQFLFSPSAATGQLLSTLTRRLATLNDGFSVTFDPEETGFAERIRVEYADIQVILAFLKFTQGMQLLNDMYSAGTVDATYATYLEYLGDPVAIWDDHPQLLNLIQSRSGQGAQAKTLFQQAVNHYNGVESVLWSRASGPTESFLFEVDGATQAGRSEFSDALTTFIDSLDAPVALADFEPGASASQALSLQPLVAATPVNLRQVLPQFEERGFRGRSSQALVDSGFLSGFSALDVDDFLVDQGLLFVAPPPSIAGKVLMMENWGSINWARFSHDSIVQFYRWGSALNTTYTWDSQTGTIDLPVDEFGNQESYQLVFEGGLQGRVLQGSNGSFYPAGRFLLYDGSIDLDGNGRPDALDLADSTPPSLYSIDALLAADSDGDGRDTLGELIVGTDPNQRDALATPSLAGSMPTPVDPNQRFQLRFETLPGNYYQVEYTEELGRDNWLPFGPLVEGNGSQQTVEDSTGRAARFYRIRIGR